MTNLKKEFNCDYYYPISVFCVWVMIRFNKKSKMYVI